jgi:S-adenosylmethionine hydrolase
MLVDTAEIGLIASYCDFGSTGPYLGQMNAVLATQAPQTPSITLMADAPMFDAQAAGVLLCALLNGLPPNTIVLGVVDPGVGSDRRPLMIQTENNLFVGPDNGLLVPAVRQSRSCVIEAILWRPERLSASFHGRDLFAPVAAKLANGEAVQGKAMNPEEMAGYASPFDGNRVVYIDHYGNAITGIDARHVDDSKVFTVNGRELRYARVFDEVPAGQAFWYRNSMELVELAVNRGSASERLNILLGAHVV